MRTHGAASDDPDILQVQLTTSDGGCNPECQHDLRLQQSHDPHQSFERFTPVAPQKQDILSLLAMPRDKLTAKIFADKLDHANWMG